MADGDSVQTSNAPSLRAVDEFRSSNSAPEACNLNQAGLVASLVLEDIDVLRGALADRIERTAAGTPARMLATRLAEAERLAFAAQRLRVEALSARLRYDLSTMERLSADVFFHVSEAGETMRSVIPLAGEVAAGPAPTMSVVEAYTPATSAPPSRIVAAALGLDHTTAPSIVPPVPAETSADDSDRVGSRAVESTRPPAGGRDLDTPAWSPPIFRPLEPQRGPVGEWLARQKHVRDERKLIRADEKQRGRGLRPRLPTWLSQAFATVAVVTLMAVVVIGTWMLLVSGAGPF